ncbi:hypothetical protein LTR27_011232 [Elasticomyces elasticus]|nr:hypothetical protein LTR27_011232 [Elasticomyces elasticus]
MQNTGESVMHRHLKAVDWTGRLLAGFAAAHLDLAPRRIADNATKCLERLVNSRMTGVAELPLASMTTLLGKELRRSACTPCSPKAFGQFLTLIEHDEGPRRIELARARFILFHPTRATARPFIELVPTEHPELTVILRARSEARNNLSSDLMRAAYILRVEGSEDDATYLEGIVQNLTPLVWHARERIWQDLQDDPKLRKAETTQRRPLPTWSASRKTRMFSTSALLHPRTSTIVTSSRSFSCAARLQAAGAGSDALMMKIDKFQKSVGEGKATIEDAQQCLLELQADLTRLPLEERRLKCQELMAGGKVLHWLWKVRKADYANIYDGTNVQAFSTLHLWFLVPENLEEFVWKWLHIVANHILSSRDYRVFDRQKPVNQQQEYNEFGWAHHVLGALVEAHVQWSADRTANDALRAWERAFHAFGPASHGREWRAIPLVAMSVCIARHLQREDLAPCDPELYDTWGRTYAQSGLAGPHRLANRRVRHDLYHPTHADPASMLHMVYHSGRPLDDVMFLHSRSITSFSTFSCFGRVRSRNPILWTAPSSATPFTLSHASLENRSLVLRSQTIRNTDCYDAELSYQRTSNSY